jgi:uncharacterized membrane protein YdfJ with MMPL/SSD domain
MRHRFWSDATARSPIQWAPVALAALAGLIILAIPVAMIKLSRMTFAVDGKPYGALAARFRTVQVLA